MADIFISYSKPDRDKVVMLAAYLESEGWTVWWDTNLAVGDAFRDEIMKQLAAAGAVIVLWTPHSIKSDFVRAEAGRAKADGKLIPVKDREVEYREIPLPFGEMHTENLANRELIRAAVVAQVAKPAQQQRMLHAAGKTLQYQVLTWMGIVGGAITLFVNLREVLNLADWARWLVTHWHEISAVFWQWCFSFIHIQLPPNWALLLSFLFFGTVITLSQRKMAAQARKRAQEWMLSDEPALRLLSTKAAIAVLVIIFMPLTIWLGIQQILALGNWVAGSPIATFAASSVVAMYMLSPQVMLVVASSHRFKAACIVFLMAVFFGIVVVLPYLIGGRIGGSPLFGLALLSICSAVTAAMLAVAPVNGLLKRLTFLAIGLIVLVALNELSHFAPDIREWLKPPV